MLISYSQAPADLWRCGCDQGECVLRVRGGGRRSSQVHRSGSLQRMAVARSLLRAQPLSANELTIAVKLTGRTG
jgi:hypothetical protein